MKKVTIILGFVYAAAIGWMIAHPTVRLAEETEDKYTIVWRENGFFSRPVEKVLEIPLVNGKPICAPTEVDFSIWLASTINDKSQRTLEAYKKALCK